MNRENETVAIPALLPLEEHNRRLQASVHPPDWRNPTPRARYDLVVIGGGTAGLVTAAGAAGLGANVALVEKGLLGGDCLNVGCVPSKTLIRSAKVAASMRDAENYGVELDREVQVDFPAVMERLRRVRADIAPHDSARRFTEIGVDVFLGSAAFETPHFVRVGDAKLRYSRAVIATGGRASAPPIPGLSEAGYLTNETVFSLTELPPRLAVVGAGPIGCEMAQAFARLGSEVTLIEAERQILPREDVDAAQIVDAALRRDGIEVICGGKAAEVRVEGRDKVMRLDCDGEIKELRVDEILIGVGRAPNVQGLNLDAVSVRYDSRNGVAVNDFLQTTNRRIYAAGDICSPYKFTHVSDAHARIVIQNALFFGRKRVSRLTIPWCTYTDPEIAHVGLYEREAKARGFEVQTILVDLSSVDRAVLDGEDAGLLKVHVKAGSDRILGATLVARHAGEMISEITATMAAGGGMKSLGQTIHPYPTQAEIIRKAADAWNRSRLTPGIRRVLSALITLRR